MSEITVSSNPIFVEISERPLVHQGHPCITLRLMDQLHQRPDGKAQQRLEVAHENLAVKQAQTDTLARAALAQAESNHGYYAVLGYLKLIGREVSVGEAARHGKRLTALCNARGCKVNRVRDTRHGYVNTYPESILDEYFRQS